MKSILRRNALTTLFILIFIFFIFAIIGGFLWTYTINTWLVYFGKEPSVMFWQGAILGFIPGIGQTELLLSALTWIIMLFLM